MNITNQSLNRKLAALCALAIVTGASCDSTTTGTTTYYDPYLYTAYYPADLAYTGYYGASSWDYGYYTFDVVVGLYGGTTTGGTGGSGGGTTTDQGTGLGATIRALIRGESICPGQVTVTPKTAAPACAGPDTQPVRDGITIVFAGCQLPGGGSVDGTFDVLSTRSASEQVCSATTSVSLGHTTTITNLTYTNPSGGRVVIPSQTDHGTTSYTFGQTPTTFTIETTGELQLFDSSGTMLADLMHDGSRTYTFAPAAQSYSFDGTTNVQDLRAAGTATLTATGLTRTAGCCRPTGGTLEINYTAGAMSGTRNTWTFGPSCGSASRDGQTVTLPACI